MADESDDTPVVYMYTIYCLVMLDVHTHAHVCLLYTVLCSGLIIG